MKIRYLSASVVLIPPLQAATVADTRRKMKFVRRTGGKFSDINLQIFGPDTLLAKDFFVFPHFTG